MQGGQTFTSPKRRRELLALTLSEAFLETEKQRELLSHSEIRPVCDNIADH